MTALPNSGRSRALRKAVQYKRAWVVSAAWVGYMPDTTHVVAIPNYESLSRKDLENEVRLLRDDFNGYLNHIIGKLRTNAIELRALKFFSDRYESVINATGPLSLCDVQAFSSLVAPVPEATKLDAPPYTEVLMQGFRGVAFRHPEYMLARDVEFNYDLFWQTEDLVRKHMRERRTPRWMGHAVENVQSLARSTILSCFSLLESTVSGLARAHVMTHPGVSERERKVLANNHRPLLERILLVPEIIKGELPRLRSNTLPLSKLFGEIKQRRDAFVHCEPGDQESRPGFIKQERFHDVSADAVDDAVRLTAQVVRLIWQHVHDVEKGPVWLRGLGDRSAYQRGLRVEPCE